MPESALKELSRVVAHRKACPEEGSYTCYLFEKGLDKILKKCGEECTEVVIAAKGEDKEELANEICDLLYHLVVLMEEKGVSFDKVEDILSQRALKIGNLKNIKKVDHNT